MRAIIKMIFGGLADSCTGDFPLFNHINVVHDEIGVGG